MRAILTTFLANLLVSHWVKKASYSQRNESNHHLVIEIWTNHLLERFYLLWWSIISTRWQHSAFGQVKTDVKNSMGKGIHNWLEYMEAYLLYICYSLFAKDFYFLLRILIYSEHSSDDAKYWSQYSHGNSLNPNLTFSHLSLRKEIDKIRKRLQIHRSIKKDSTGLSWFMQGTCSWIGYIKNK